jgi:hypothetical protein
MTPETLEQLFTIDPAEISYDGEIYAINHLLKMTPWMPPCVEVWVCKEDRPGYENPNDWNYVLAILNRLHDEHERRK